MTANRRRKRAIRRTLQSTGRRYAETERETRGKERCHLCGWVNCGPYRKRLCPDGCTEDPNWESEPSCIKCRNILCLFCGKPITEPSCQPDSICWSCEEDARRAAQIIDANVARGCRVCGGEIPRARQWDENESRYCSKSCDLSAVAT